MSFDKTTTGDEVVKAFGAQVKGKTGWLPLNTPDPA